MNLSGLLPALRALPEYRSALASLADKKRRGFALNLQRAARIPVTAALAEDARCPALVVAARVDRALTFAEELSAWNPAAPVLQFNEPAPLFYEYDAWGARTLRARIMALAALANLHSPLSPPHSPLPPPPPPPLVPSARALMTRTIPRRDFVANTRALKVGQTVRLEKMLETWVGAGYTAETIVVEPGQFARRGGIIDIFPVADALPARLELFGDDIETIRRFDPATQRSGEAVESLTITPAREALPRHWKEEGQRETDGDDSNLQDQISNLEFHLPRMFPPASLLEYLPEDSLVLVDDWQELADTIGEFEEQAVQLRGEQLEAGLIDEDFPLPYHTWAELQDELAEREPIFLAARMDEDAQGAAISLAARFHPGPR